MYGLSIGMLYVRSCQRCHFKPIIAILRSYVLLRRPVLIFIPTPFLIPKESQIKRIFGTMINQKLQDFDEDVKPLGDIMTQATIEIYNFISTRMLPTPAKIHYLFNLRDISKVCTCRL